MPSSNLTYFVKTPDGQEYGPADQQMLIQWAKSGRLTRDCQVRNVLIKQWQAAEKLDFLAPVLPAAKKTGAAPAVDLDNLGRKKDIHYSLVGAGIFKCKPATLGLRLGAWLFDTLLFALVGLALVLAGHFAGQAAPELREQLFLGLTILFAGGVLLYYTVMLGFSAQTLGQWFFGIMILRPGGGPVLAGRAFLWTLALLLLWPTTFLFVFVLPSKRALQDLLSGVLVVRITNRETL